MYSAIGTTGLKRTAADLSQHPMLSGPPPSALCAMFRELFRSRRRPQPCRAGGRRGGAGGGADVCARCVVLPAAAGGAADPRGAAAGGAGRPGACRMGHRRPSPGGESAVCTAHDSCNHQWAGVALFNMVARPVRIAVHAPVERLPRCLPSLQKCVCATQPTQPTTAQRCLEAIKLAVSARRCGRVTASGTRRASSACLPPATLSYPSTRTAAQRR